MKNIASIYCPEGTASAPYVIHGYEPKTSELTPRKTGFAHSMSTESAQSLEI